jgi:hypothetical protein
MKTWIQRNGSRYVIGRRGGRRFQASAVPAAMSSLDRLLPPPPWRPLVAQRQREGGAASAPLTAYRGLD